MFFLLQREGKSSIGNRIFVHQRTALAIKRVEVVSDRMSHTVLRGRWCNIISLNAHAPTEAKGEDSKDSFYEELEGVFSIIFVSTT
jgi:hypothetical protein